MIRYLQFLVLLSFAVHSVDAQCREKSHKYIGDLCYILPNDKLTFQDALNSCHQVSTQLAVIHTTTQANHLATLVRKQSDNSNDLFWIGLSRQTVNSEFQWDDGTKMLFSNFDSNFPKDNLFAVESTVNGKWRTLDGHEQLPFVCSYDPNSLPITTPTPEPIDSSCTPQSNHTFLFAYSNDLDPKVVQDSIQKVLGWHVDGNYSTFGTVRFDTKNAGSFHFFNDLNSLSQSVNSNLPDPSLSFSNNQTGSDILNVLQRFLDNTDGVPLCGSQIFILLKRHPLETNTSNLLDRLQNHHVFIKTVMSNTPILGGNYQVMYNLSGLTNGLAGFVNDEFMNLEIDYFSDVLWYQFQIYSINPIGISGIERMDLPVLRIPIPQSDSTNVFSRIEISGQDHGPLDKFRYFNMTLTNTMDPTDRINLYENNCIFGSTNLFETFFPTPGANYSVNLRTEFSDSKPENLQVRIWAHTDTPINYWLPFTNWN